MVTFLDYTAELLIDPYEDARTRPEGRVYVGFNYRTGRSLVFLSVDPRSGTYDPATHTLLSTHVMECGAEYPVYLHTQDRDQARYARDALHTWATEYLNVADMPMSVHGELDTHLSNLGHYSHSGCWQVAIARGSTPVRYFGAFSTPNMAAETIAGGRIGELAGIDSYDDDLGTLDLTVVPALIGAETAAR